ncbi:hypothetical protein HWV23_08185 [Natronomonas halophila]|uniref:hypothetical protein n=1 Tax=Natronomonas halophila TaxID=2747817 RepID=UPI0015B43288|nr:hypothetical protein [Natronomonas halophila]QLD85703.1 hypothetical protein HWV23_08185 [Natronomonas halophila]
MVEVEIQDGLRENTVGIVEQFIEIASADPLSAILIAIGAVLIAISAGGFGVLTLGAVLSAIGRLLPSQQPPQQAR